jgi:hypothetical protein
MSMPRGRRLTTNSLISLVPMAALWEREMLKRGKYERAIASRGRAIEAQPTGRRQPSIVYETTPRAPKMLVQKQAANLRFHRVSR